MIYLQALRVSQHFQTAEANKTRAVNSQNGKSTCSKKLCLSAVAQTCPPLEKSGKGVGLSPSCYYISRCVCTFKISWAVLIIYFSPVLYFSKTRLWKHQARRRYILSPLYSYLQNVLLCFPVELLPLVIFNLAGKNGYKFLSQNQYAPVLAHLSRDKTSASSSISKTFGLHKAGQLNANTERLSRHSWAALCICTDTKQSDCKWLLKWPENCPSSHCQTKEKCMACFFSRMLKCCCSIAVHLILPRVPMLASTWTTGSNKQCAKLQKAVSCAKIVFSCILCCLNSCSWHPLAEYTRAFE